MFDPNRQVLINKPKKLTKKQLDGLFKQGLSYLDNPKIKPKIEKQISLYDRLNALLRMPEVEDMVRMIDREIDSSKKYKQASNFEKRYGVDSSFVKRIMENPKNIEKSKNKHYGLDSIHVFHNWLKDRPITEYRDGKHIILAVDLSRKRKDIERDFKKMLTNIYKDYQIPKDKSRCKEFSVVDIWEVYDLIIKKALNYSQVARELSGEKGNFIDNPKLRGWFDAVKRGYKKAEGIIDILRKS